MKSLEWVISLDDKGRHRRSSFKMNMDASYIGRVTSGEANQIVEDLAVLTETKKDTETLPIILALGLPNHLAPTYRTLNEVTGGASSRPLF